MQFDHGVSDVIKNVGSQATPFSMIDRCLSGPNTPSIPRPLDDEHSEQHFYDRLGRNGVLKLNAALANFANLKCKVSWEVSVQYYIQARRNKIAIGFANYICMRVYALCIVVCVRRGRIPSRTPPRSHDHSEYTLAC